MIEYIVITCGGTGGHFYPGLSIARTQQARGKKVLLLLSGKNSAEQKKIADEVKAAMAAGYTVFTAEEMDAYNAVYGGK